jgi:hypothetical protein
MTFGQILLIGVAVGAALVLALELPEMRRYYKMATM